MDSFKIAREYVNGNLCGWAGKNNPELVKTQFNLYFSDKPEFKIIKKFGDSATRKKTHLHWFTRKVLGKDTDNYPQEIGDCVSFGMKNALEYLTCTQILANALSQTVMSIQDFIATAKFKFRPVFPPYLYGIGRNYIGKNQLGSGDGSLGSWMAEAVLKYGSLFSDEPGVPRYSGSIAKAWGDSRSSDDLDKFVNIGQQRLVKSTALIRNWDDLCAAIHNGYPCTTASDIGYNMEASSDGFHRQTTNWGHQMCFISVDQEYKEEYALILNNWGDCHGRLKDFTTNEDLPIGVLRVRRKDAEKHIAAGETYAISQYDAFHEQQLDKALFMLYS